MMLDPVVIRDKAEVGIFEAVDACKRNILRHELTEVKTVEDLKKILLRKFPEHDLITRFFPNEVVK